jgi:hypothetical protein
MRQAADHNNGQATTAIPARLQRRARRLLAAGATFEETLAELRRRGATELTLKAVQDFFRSNPEVQRERIERRRQAVEELKQALAGPGGLHRSLAEAALLTGLTELTAPRGLYRSQLNNCRLEIHTQRLKCQKATLGERVAHTRLKLAMVRWEMARLRFVELERELAEQLGQHDLHLPALAAMRKIHGLIGNPTAAPRHRDGSGQRPATAQNNSSGGQQNHGTTQTGNSQ